ARRADGKLKVGYSANPTKRMDGLRAQFGMKFTLVRKWKHDRAVNVEAVAHRLLVDHLAPDVEGIETYNADERIVVTAIKEAIWRFNRRNLRGVPTRTWARYIRLPSGGSWEEVSRLSKEWFLGLGIEDDQSPEAFAAVDQWIAKMNGG